MRVLAQGDIRRANLLLAANPKDSVIIDFDMARELAKNPCYPSNYNRIGIPERHSNAVAGRRMVKLHDWHSLWYSLYGSEPPVDKLGDNTDAGDDFDR